MDNNGFFAQSYNDALNDYVYSCNNLKSNRWDWIVLTASNERQADAYRLQIDKRKNENRLPCGTRFCVIPDYLDMRVGSGGATLNVLRCLSEMVGTKELLMQKILVIHSGGDSKRIPQYSACGKIFAPVPRLLPSGHISTIFDELIIAATDIPNRCGKGLMVFPSDTEMIFNSLQLDLLSCDAAGLSIKAPVLEGQDHGVFLQGKSSHDHRNKDVARFLHKQSEATLRAYGAVDNSNQVNIDTGCIWLSNRIAGELLQLVSTNGRIDQTKFDKFVNPKVCLNFYADFVYPLACEGTLDEFYQEAPENGYSDELRECRKEIWSKLNPFKLSLVKMVPARYIHFGMTHEMYELLVNDIETYDYLGWKSRVITNAKTGTVINSFVSDDAKLPERCYIEDSIVKNCRIGKGAILSNVDIEDVEIPSNVVMHALKLKSGKYICRIYGKNDNPKASYSANFMESSLSKLVSVTGIDMDSIWYKNTPSIWNACIYPECDSMRDAVKSALELYSIMCGLADETTVSKWKQAVRYSLANSFNEADVSWIVNRRYKITEKVVIENFVKNVEVGMDITEAINGLKINADSARQFILKLKEKAEESRFPCRMRLYLACADLCKKYALVEADANYSLFEDAAYDVVRTTIVNATFDKFNLKFKDLRMIKESETVELPVRVNFCGSPSDAAPYCLEHGGTMIDGALLLKGKKPIKVTANKIPEREIRFGSLDQGCEDSFTDIKDIRNCSNPMDPYALHKAVLVATGIVPFDVSHITMDEFCDQLGGGIEILTTVDVPKGSGLGTSSIIAAAAVKSVNELCGIHPTEEMIYAQVFLVEQLMTTGGGWQDQVGGLTDGVKCFTSKPGAYQEIEVERLNLSTEIMNELNERFVLIFSGQRRLARDVLREEMNQCIRNDKYAINTMSRIQEYCAIMRYYLLKGDITSFAHYISKQFELVKAIDKGASNTCIEYIFDVCDDLLDGKSICGAGGGGFLQVILKKGVTKQMLRDRIHETFIDCGVEVWDCELI